MATQGFLSSLELRVQFCLLVCCTYLSLSTVNKEKNLPDQRASLRVDTRETQQSACLLSGCFRCLCLSFFVSVSLTVLGICSVGFLFVCLFACLLCFVFVFWLLSASEYTDL